VLGTIAESVSGASNTNWNLFPDLINIYQSIENLWDTGCCESSIPVYKARGLVFDLIVSLGYEQQYDEWRLAWLDAKGLATADDKEWVEEKYGKQGATNE
jgi:hypothetical protein